LFFRSQFGLARSSSLAGNVLGLCDEAEFEAQMFGLAQIFIRIPNVQFSNEPAILPNCCYLLAFLLVIV
jgi:hypothetical protein